MEDDSYYRNRPRPRPDIKGTKLPVRPSRNNFDNFVEYTKSGDMVWKLERGRWVGSVNESVPIIVNRRNMCFIEWQGEAIIVDKIPDGLIEAIVGQQAGWYE